VILACTILIQITTGRTDGTGPDRMGRDGTGRTGPDRTGPNGPDGRTDRRPDDGKDAQSILLSRIKAIIYEH